MKIGIIVDSKTGNTYSVAEKVKTHINDEVELIRLDIKNEVPPFTILTKVDFDKYDVIIFGAPVEAFRLNQRMTQYLKEIISLENKKIGLFTTQHLKYPWLGGNSAIKKMKKICSMKGADIYCTGIVNWTNEKREMQIEELAVSLSKY